MSWIAKNVDPDVADYLFNLRVELPGRTVFQKDVRPDLRIDFDDLEEELAVLPEQLVFFDMLLAEQRAVVAVLEARKEAVRGQIVSTIQEKARLDGVKLSVQVIKDLALADERMIRVEAEIVNESRKEHKIRALVYALCRKSEHLRSLAGFKREEQRRS